MEIIIAKNTGLGYGVKRALKIALETRRILPRACFIENADQIKSRMLQRANTIGISGGASTPPEAIEAAVRKIRRNFEQPHHEESRAQ